MLLKLFFSLVILALSLAAPFGLLFQNLNDSGGFKRLPERSPVLSAPQDGYYGTPTRLSPLDSSADFCVTVEFLGIVPATPAVDLGLLVGVTGPGKSEVQRLAQEHYKSVTLWITSYSGFSSIQIRIDLSLLEHPQGGYSACDSGALNAPDLDQSAAFRTVLNNITMIGQPRAFPDDWYELNDSVFLEKGQAVNGGGLPSSLIMMSRDEDFATTVKMDPGNQPYVHQLWFMDGRPFVWMRLYTYFIAALPFLLLVALLAGQYVRSRPQAYEMAFGVAAALVAILPLRTVLVPSSLPGLTRLDIVFGIEAAVLVAGSILLAIIWFPGD